MENSEPAKTENDHNVYILGAGFSAEAGLPLIKDFMNRMRDAAAWLAHQSGRDREGQAIESVLRFRLRAASASYRVPLDVENIEELFSLASANGDEQLSQSMPLAIAATLDYTRTIAPAIESQAFAVGWLNELPKHMPASWGPAAKEIVEAFQKQTPKRSWAECPPYEFYLGLMCGFFYAGKGERRDTIITFNYDTLVEEALLNLGIVPDYCFSDEEIRYTGSENRMILSGDSMKVAVLKPHGSVNWSALWPEEKAGLKLKMLLAKIAVLSEESPNDPEALKRLLEGSKVAAFQLLRIYANYSSLRADRLFGYPFLVPPTWQKRFAGYLATVWNRAVDALRTATRIIILGYSIPLTDQHFKYLLVAGLQDNISLRKIFFVNPGLAEETVKTHLNERLFGRTGLFRKEHFDQGITELIPLTVRQFLAAPNNSTPQHYRLLINRPLNGPKSTYDPMVPWRCYPATGSGEISV